MMLVNSFLFLILLGQCRTQTNNRPSILSYRNGFAGEMIDRRRFMTVAEKKNYTLKYAHNHLYAIRFFEGKYMSPQLINHFPEYAKIREDVYVSKYYRNIAKRPFSRRFGKPHSHLLPQEAMAEWNEYRIKHDRLYQREKWPVFLRWLIYHPEEWSIVDGNVGRLNFLRQEFLDASQYGLTIRKFANCIINEWRSCSCVVKYQERHDFASIFDRLIPQLVPTHVDTCCFAFLEAALDAFPLTVEEESDYMNKWEFGEIKIGNTLPPNQTTT